MKPSKTLKPSLTYWTKPYAASFRTISTEKIQLNTRLLTSTTFVRVSGWSWYSMPMLNVLMKMQRRIPCWKIVWSTQKFKQALIRPKKLLIPFRHAEKHLKYCLKGFRVDRVWILKEPKHWFLFCCRYDVEVSIQMIDTLLLLFVHS